MSKANSSPGSQLKLKLPKVVAKKQKGFYLEVEIIEYIKEEKKRLGVSDNVLLTAIINFYRANGE